MKWIKVNQLIVMTVLVICTVVHGQSPSPKIKKEVVYLAEGSQVTMTIEIPIEQIPARYLHIEITGPDSYFGTMKLQKVENKLKTPSADDEQERTRIKLMYTIIDKDSDTKLNNVTKLYFGR